MIEKPTNTMTIKVKMTEMDEVKDIIISSGIQVGDIITSFIFMLEDTRIDRDIRKQYLETCKPLKENFFVRIDK